MIFGIERLISFFRKVRKEDPLRVTFYDKTEANPRFHSDYTGKLPFMKSLSAANRNPGVLAASPSFNRIFKGFVILRV